jgi:tRNA pseudouridine55 synthase
MTTPTSESPSSSPAGLLILDKPAGWTSHQVVARVRRLLGTRKVGHAGTLDPMATGVLLVGVGRATRLLGHLSRSDKSYRATIRLGVATVTDDADGHPTESLGAGGLADVTIEDAVDRLRGEIEQVPSAVSAIKIDGVRSYARVRAGVPTDLAARPVSVHRFEVLERRDDVVEGLPVTDLDVEVGCSTGTYVRALARDLGVALGTGGHLTALRRTRVGGFAIAESSRIDPPPDDLRMLSLADAARRAFPVLEVDDEQATAVRHGRRLPDLALPSAPTALLDQQGELLALYRPVGADAVAEAVFVG